MPSDPCYPYGYDVHTTTEVVPKPPPEPTPPSIKLRWTIGPVRAKTQQPEPGSPGTPATGQEEITVQITADQEVPLNIAGEDAYGNPVEITSDNAVWSSSDESIVTVAKLDADDAVARAVGPAGTTAVSVADTGGTMLGSIAVDVVAGQITEIVIVPGAPRPKTQP